MTIGTGMVLTAVWIFAAVAAGSKYVSGIGLCVAVVVALVVTFYLGGGPQ